MKIICQLTAGSRLYGLETPESDTDTRGVFLDTDIGSIIGLDRMEVVKKSSEDHLLFEFRHFLNGLRKTNTQMMELVFADDGKFSILESEFKTVRANKFRLIESRTFFKSLIGYMENERRLAVGERTGELGSKRKQNLDKFGFSPKNFSHLFRLAYCGTSFFETDNYPVDIGSHDRQFRDFIFSVKTEPEKFKKNELNDIANEMLGKLKNSYEKRKKDHKFDKDLANKLCLDFYLPFLNNLVVG